MSLFNPHIFSSLISSPADTEGNVLTGPGLVCLDKLNFSVKLRKSESNGNNDGYEDVRRADRTFWGTKRMIRE